MIVTVTLNPAVDISYPLKRLDINAANRVQEVSKTAGGKGLNVARVLSQLGEAACASGFLGGSLGDFIRSEIKKQGIADEFVEIGGETRNCIAILHEGNQTEILEAGPEISAEEEKRFLTEYKRFIQEASVITLNGSLPAGLDASFYSQLIALAKQAGKPVLLDTGGAVTRDILSGADKPFLIKPNKAEFAELIGTESVTKEEVIQALDDPIFSGIEWVLVTLGESGAVVKRSDSLYETSIPKVEVVNPVGSGDSVIAGFALAHKRGYSTERAISFAMTMGILNAMEETTGSVQVDRIEEIEGQVLVEKIS